MSLLNLVLPASLALLLAGPAFAQAHEHMYGEHSVHEGAAAPAADLAGAWSELQAARDGIAADVDAGRLQEIHAKSERLAPLARTLVERSTSLAPDKRARVEATAKQTSRVAGLLHAAADRGDAPATKRELGRLDGLLELIRAQYPAGSLAPLGQPTAHEGHSQATPEGSAHAHAHGSAPLTQVDAKPEATLHVKGSEYDFQPRTLQLRAGVPTRIEFENGGSTEHSLVVKAPDGSGDWIHLHAGAKGADAGTYRIDQPGEYPLLCTIVGHTEAGMVGLVVVKK